MALTADELLIHLKGVTDKFDFLLDTPSVDIGVALVSSSELIPSVCKYRYNDILYNLTVHLIVQKIEDKKAFKEGDVTVPQDLNSFEIGDVKASLSEGTEIPWFFNSSRWGVRAWNLLLNCSRSRIGIIV